MPVFLTKEETDHNFERLTRLLFENIDVVRPAVSTHNLRSICHGIAAAEAMKVPADAFEFQMLYGMAEPLRKAVRGRGFDIRIYAPVGELIPGMAYLVRRLLENTSNESFLRKSFGAKTSFDELIKPPSPRIVPSERAGLGELPPIKGGATPSPLVGEGWGEGVFSNGFLILLPLFTNSYPNRPRSQRK